MERCSLKKRIRTESMPDWSSLHADLLVGIAKLTLSASVEDFNAFRGVCRPWRIAVARNLKQFDNSFPRVPFLMLAESEGGSEERALYSLSRKKVFMTLSVPEAKGMKCIEVGFGWLLTIACSPEKEGEVALLNPLTGARIALPNFRTNYKVYPHYKYWRTNPPFVFIRKAVLSADPSCSADFVLVAAMPFYMAFWTLGDENWMEIRACKAEEWTRQRYDDQGPFLDLNYCKRDSKFYAVRMRDIVVWDAATHDPVRVIMRYDNTIVNAGPVNDVYLVESSDWSELFLVTRNGRRLRDCRKFQYGATDFRVYRLDVENGVCERIWSLKNDAIYVGHNAAFSIGAGCDDVGSNCIYFSDDAFSAYGYVRSPYTEHMEDDGTYGIWPQPLAGDFDARLGGGKDSGIYNVEDGSFERFGQEAHTLSYHCPPIWVAPSSSSWLSYFIQGSRKSHAQDNGAN